MRLACRLINGDGIGFEYVIVELTSDYVADLLRLVDEAKRLKEMDATFCEIEFMDYEAQYGSSLGDLENNLPEFGEGKKWIEVPDDFQWPKDSQQSVASSTVAVTKGALFWRALGSHDFGGPYFESDELSVDELRRLFPQSPCECEQPGNFCSGVPGILARVKNGQLAEGAKVERCDSCQRYPSDKEAFEKLVELGMVPNAKQYVQQGGGFCPNCRSDQIEGDSVDFDGPNCTQRMRCLECDTDWSDVYVLSSVELQ